jgi:hypothetical protein
MPINNLPTALQSVIQQGYLQREFERPLVAKLGFRAIADKETFAAEIGETITKTRLGLLPAVTQALPPAANTDLTSGITEGAYGVEQYTLGIAQYGSSLSLNVATSRVAIDRLFLQNASKLAEQAQRSVDTLAASALFNGYMGGNTFVRTTLGAAGTQVAVDDIRGFQYTWDSEGRPVPVSSSNPVNVVVGADVYSLVGAAADATNVSLTPGAAPGQGGISGVLTFATAVTVADGTAKNPVISAVAPYVARPMDAASNSVAASSVWGIGSSLYNGGRLSMQMIIDAKAQMSSNGVQPVAETGMFHLYASPKQIAGLFSDNDFKLLFRGTETSSPEMRKAIVSDLLGVSLFETNINPSANFSGVGAVQYGALVGQGALVEGEFTKTAYAEVDADSDEGSLIENVDGIEHITREPLDALKQVVTQSWSYIGGFVTPTDVTTNPSTVPTASNAALKRGILFQSL